VLTRRDAANLDPVLLVALQQTAALLWALLIWPLELGSGEMTRLTAIGSRAWLWAVASGIVYYALAFWFYIIGLKRIPASLAGLFLNLIPIFAVGGAYLFLGERLAAVQWVGAALILASVAVMARLQTADTVSTTVGDQGENEMDVDNGLLPAESN
jgi:drug/metabolite transporter (DMT)-like permease